MVFDFLCITLCGQAKVDTFLIGGTIKIVLLELDRTQISQLRMQSFAIVGSYARSGAVIFPEKTADLNP